MDARSLSPRDVRIRLASCFAVVFLSLDVINPVKVVCSILGISTGWVGLIGLLTSGVIIYANASDMLYFAVKIFIKSIMSIFFSSIEVLGKQNIPQHGPIIFTGNHMNQFVDAALILVTSPHRVGFLIAEKSFNTKIIGGLAKAVGCYPVARPQDKAKSGEGQIYFDGSVMRGQGTRFTQFTKGDRVRPARSAAAYRIKEILSDVEATLADDLGEPSPLNESECQGLEKWVKYDIFEHIDQGDVFVAVEDALAKGNNLGIFPEGGSHDNTDLLPLKAGISAITFGVLQKYDVNVPIIPVGLNYFRGHRFRGRVVIEFGQPIQVSSDLHDEFKRSKRVAYTKLLTQVEEGMRSVIVTGPNYDELRLIHTARRLYQKASVRSISIAQRQDLARRFSVAYSKLKERYGDNIPDDLRSLQERVQKYQDALEELGVRDYQVVKNEEQDYSRMLFVFLHGFMVMTLASIPSIILNAPVGFAAKYWSFLEAQKDLKASRVKVAARDVLLSKKIVFCLVAVPITWVSYAILLMLFTKWELRTIIVLLLCFPIFSYIGVMGVESGMVDLKDLRPAFLRILPGFREKFQELYVLRQELQKDVRTIVKKYGPSFDQLYYDKSTQWEQYFRKSLSEANLSEMTAENDASKKDN